MAKRKPTPRKRSFINRPLSLLSKLKPIAGAKGSPAKEGSAGPKEPEEAGPQEEGQLFAEAMAGIKPLSARSDLLPPPPHLTPTPTADEREAAEVMRALRDLVEGEAPLSIHQTDEAIEGSVEGIDPRLMHKLRNGEFSIQDHLDLHGYNREEAREKVESFLLEAIIQGKRCVLIIHGRGHGSRDHVPVLKNALSTWFTRRALRKKILAFTTARVCDGGSGAIYVLLGKHRPR